MRRENWPVRKDYLGKIERLGMSFHTLNGLPYWDESVAYRFDTEEIDTLESASRELHEKCLEAVEHIICNRQLGRLGIPECAHSVIEQAWEADPPAIYGRLDLAYNGGPPKLLEYNADTPTSLLEAAVIQWHWLQDVNPEADQFNSIWEGLVQKWSDLKKEGYLQSNYVHFGCVNEPEDLMTTAVLMDTAQEAGLAVSFLQMADIGWNSIQQCLVDQGGRPMQTLFKLYPWEWILRDPFGPMVLQTYREMQWIEPIWKMVLSNKAVLAILWELFPDHPNLLPAYLDGPRDMDEFVTKPFWGREGANVSISSHQHSTAVDGPYAKDPVIWQAYSPLPVFDGNNMLIGAWIIDGEPRGIGIRESDGPITEDHARFVPHYFTPASAAGT